MGEEGAVVVGFAPAVVDIVFRALVVQVQNVHFCYGETLGGQSCSLDASIFVK